jgi:hypothetical protein
MKKLLVTTAALFAGFTSFALAQNCGGGCATMTTSTNSYYCTNGRGELYICDNGGTVSVISGTALTCCTMSYDDGSLASWAARKAVESQQGAWWGDDKTVGKLTREEVDARQERLEALQKWAKTLSNHIFCDAYVQWANSRLSELATRRRSLDQLDVALSVVKGLPQPPDSAH